MRHFSGKYKFQGTQEELLEYLENRTSKMTYQQKLSVLAKLDELDNLDKVEESLQSDGHVEDPDVETAKRILDSLSHEDLLKAIASFEEINQLDQVPGYNELNPTAKGRVDHLVNELYEQEQGESVFLLPAHNEPGGDYELPDPVGLPDSKSNQWHDIYHQLTDDEKQDLYLLAADCHSSSPAQGETMEHLEEMPICYQVWFWIVIFLNKIRSSLK